MALIRFVANIASFFAFRRYEVSIFHLLFNWRLRGVCAYKSLFISSENKVFQMIAERPPGFCSGNVY